MTKNENETTPLISATKLAARWNKHQSTIARMVRDGVIKPVARAGCQMTFSMTDVHRVEEGIFPKLRELPSIVTLLNLEREKLTPAGLDSLSNVFYSVPYSDRLDAGLLAGYLELGYRLISAVSRAESMRTIAGSPELIAKVKNIQGTVNGLLPQEGLYN